MSETQESKSSNPAERRQFPRRPGRGEAACRIGQSDAAPTRARVLDVSQSGICLVVAATIAVGTLLHIELTDATARLVANVSATVQWSCDYGDGRTEVGCLFKQRLGFEQLMQLEL